MATRDETNTHPVILELGCGDRPTPGCIHHDRIKHSPHVDVAFDLRVRPWPIVLYRRADGRSGVSPGILSPSQEGLDIADARRLTRQRIDQGGSPWLEDGYGTPYRPLEFVDHLLAIDVFEHIDDQIQPWLDECWDLLVPDGLLEFRVPAHFNSLSYRDPTHLRVFHEQTFEYWDPDSELQQRFGAVYFAESNRWWKQEELRIEEGDLRFRLRKRPRGA